MRRSCMNGSIKITDGSIEENNKPKVIRCSKTQLKISMNGQTLKRVNELVYLNRRTNKWDYHHHHKPNRRTQKKGNPRPILFQIDKKSDAVIKAQLLLKFLTDITYPMTTCFSPTLLGPRRKIIRYNIYKML